MEPDHRVPELGGVVGQSRRQATIQPIGGNGRGDRLHQARRNGLVPAEHVVGLHPSRQERDRGGDIRIAVAVAANPRAPPQEGPDPRRARTRRPIRRFAVVIDRQLVERCIEAAIQGRDHAEQRLVEEHEGRPNFVEWRRANGSEVRRSPQDRQLFAKPAAELAILRRTQGSVVAALEEPAPSSLRRVCGQHGAYEQAPDRLLDFARRPPSVGEPLNGLAERVPDEGLSGAPLPAADRAQALALLGQVRQLEEQAEGTDRSADLIRPGGLESRGCGLLPGPRADLRDALQKFAAGLLHDHLVEQVVEEPDLPRERIRGPV